MKIKIPTEQKKLFAGELNHCKAVSKAINARKWEPVFSHVTCQLSGKEISRIVEVDAEFIHSSTSDRWAACTGKLDVWVKVLAAFSAGYIELEGKLSEIDDLFNFGPIVVDAQVSCTTFKRA